LAMGTREAVALQASEQRPRGRKRLRATTASAEASSGPRPVRVSDQAEDLLTVEPSGPRLHDRAPSPRAPADGSTGAELAGEALGDLIDRLVPHGLAAQLLPDRLPPPDPDTVNQEG